MKALWTSVLFALVIGAPGVSSAGMMTLFDVNFSIPPHTLGAPPAVGLGPSTPTQVFFSPRVQDDVGNLAVEFRLPFAPNNPADPSQTMQALVFSVFAGASQYSIAFDIDTVNFGDPSDAFAAVFLTSSDQQNFQIDANGDLALVTLAESGLGSSIAAGTLPPGRFSRFQFDIDIAAQQIDVFQDGMVVLDSATFAPGGDLALFILAFMGVSPDTSVVVDNIVVTAQAQGRVPEPAALALLALAGLGLAVRGSRRRA